MLKKLFCVIIVFAMLCSLTGCGFLKFDSSKEKEPIDPTVSPSVYSRQISQNIKEYLKDGNVENLYGLFGKYFGVTTNDIQKLLNYIDGEIISFSNDSIQKNGGKVRDGKYTYYAYGGSFTVFTNTKMEYQVYFTGYAVHNDEPRKTGLEKITILNNIDLNDGYGVGLYYNDNGQLEDLDGNVVEWKSFVR